MMPVRTPAGIGTTLGFGPGSADVLLFEPPTFAGRWVRLQGVHEARERTEDAGEEGDGDTDFGPNDAFSELFVYQLGLCEDVPCLRPSAPPPAAAP